MNEINERANKQIDHRRTHVERVGHRHREVDKQRHGEPLCGQSLVGQLGIERDLRQTKEHNHIIRDEMIICCVLCRSF